jgi:hypothetical protein
MTTWTNTDGIARYEFLAKQLRAALLARLEKDPTLMLWAVFIGAISVFTVDDQCWLFPKLLQISEHGGLQDWDMVRKHLAMLPWVHRIHDKPAREIWKQASDYHSSKMGAKYSSE